MKFAPLPAYERERLKALNEYHILDTQPEGDFDDITDIASLVCDTPIAIVGFVDEDRQWFKSHHGVEETEVLRKYSLCAHVIETQTGSYVVNDLSKDDRFKHNPFVAGPPYLLFYAGVPLINPAGYVLGTVCVLDTRPRQLSEVQMKALQSLAAQVISKLELRKTDRKLKQKQHELDMAIADLENIAHLASHDLKSPLNNIISLSDLVKNEYGAALGDDGNEYINYLSAAAYQMSDMISGILTFSRAAKMPVDSREDIHLPAMVEEITASLALPGNTAVAYKGEEPTICSCAEALKQVLYQLIKNAAEYNDKAVRQVEVLFHADKSAYTIEVKDNGEGIVETDREQLFILFKRLKERDKTGANMGVGLAVVKRLVEKLGGDIIIHSEEGVGTSFIITLPR